MDMGLQGQARPGVRRQQGAGPRLRHGAGARRRGRGHHRPHRRPLEETAAAIRAATGAKVTAVAGDITTEEGRAAALAACPDPDILVNNAGGPPPGDFRDWERDDWIKALDANMLTPIALIKATVDGMIARGSAASSTSPAPA